MIEQKAFTWRDALMLTVLTLMILLAAVTVGSVALPLKETLSTLWYALQGKATEGMASSILLNIRLPRVLCVALTGAALSLSGASMQGLLRNPLADGSTLGVTSGAALGAVFAIFSGIGQSVGGTMGMAMLFSMLSLLSILSLSYAMDKSFSTNTIILMGVIFSMFAGSLISLLMAFSGNKLHTITFWTMGSLSGAGYADALILLAALILCGGTMMAVRSELNAFAIGEENALHIGISIRRVKLMVMVSVSCMIGVAVSIGGSIGFVGLIIPHMVRLLYGPNHQRLLPVCGFFGACFLMLCDLAARTIVSPLELPLGVVTSLVGTVVFILIFIRQRKGGRA